MADLTERIERAAQRIDPGWTEADADRAWHGVVRKRRRRLVARLTLGTALSVAALVVAGRFVLAPEPIEVVANKARGTLVLGDGSVVEPLDPGSELAVREDSARTALVDLGRGRGHFNVVPRPGRAFSVRAGEVTVTVLGTAFTVERVADRIGVGVERGRVQVGWPGGTRQLVAGESGWFPPLLTAREQAPAERPTASAPQKIAERAPAPPPRRHQPEAVIARVQKPPEPMVIPPVQKPAAPPAPEALLAAADAARLAHHPEEALAPLQQLLREHAADARAPLAAFTLGRVLLTELHRPRDAAAAFASARALAPGGAFAEDALAREVEAWAKAGEAAQARARAEEYLRLYSRGRRADVVKVLGGLE